MVSSMPRVSLGDVAREVKQRAPEGAACPSVGLEHLDPDEIELSRWNEDRENTFTKSFSRGQVLFGRRRAYLRKAVVAPFDGVCSGDITVIEARETLSPRLLPFIIQNEALFKHAVSNSAGSLSPRVKWQSLAQFEFNLPARDQQEKLADLLWTAQDTRNHYKQLLSICDDVIKSQFVEMFALQGDGEVVALRDCCASICGGKTPSMKHPEYYGGNVPFIKSGDVKGDSVSSGSLWLSDTALEEAGVKLIPQNSVLVVTRSALLQRKVSTAICNKTVAINQDIKAFTPNEEFGANYLLWAIRSHERRLLAGVRSVSTSALDFDDLCSLPIKVASKERQQEFADFVAQVDKSKFTLGSADATP